MKAPVLITERLILEPLSTKHLSLTYLSWLNDKEVCKYLSLDSMNQINQLKDYLIQIEKSDILYWAILLKSSKKHIGNIKIDPIIHKFGLCEYGILMGDKTEWSKGYAFEASKRIIDYCFFELNLRKMCLGVVDVNVNALKLYNKLNFKVEGIYRDHEFYDGKFCNGLRMALFNLNYKK